MAITSSAPDIDDALPDASVTCGAFLDRRLGLDDPAGSWPSKPRLKSYEAAGFALLQVRMPSRALLADSRAVEAHATALRSPEDPAL